MPLIVSTTPTSCQFTNSKERFNTISNAASKSRDAGGRSVATASDFPARSADDLDTVGVTVPSLFPGLGLGLLTSGSTASAFGTPTLLQWATSGFAPAASGAAELTALETGVVASGVAVVNFAYVSIAYEGGVAVGSAINASFPRHCDCR